MKLSQCLLKGKLVQGLVLNDFVFSHFCNMLEMNELKVWASNSSIGIEHRPVCLKTIKVEFLGPRSGSFKVSDQIWDRSVRRFPIGDLFLNLKFENSNNIFWHILILDNFSLFTWFTFWLEYLNAKYLMAQ